MKADTFSTEVQDHVIDTMGRPGFGWWASVVVCSLLAGVAAASMLLGLWLERLLLVTPSEVGGGQPFVGVELAIAPCLASALVLMTRRTHIAQSAR